MKKMQESGYCVVGATRRGGGGGRAPEGGGARWGVGADLRGARGVGLEVGLEGVREVWRERYSPWRTLKSRLGSALMPALTASSLSFPPPFPLTPPLAARVFAPSQLHSLTNVCAREGEGKVRWT